MMYAPAISLGVNLRLLAEGPEVGAARVIRDVVVGDYNDEATVREFAAGSRGDLRPRARATRILRGLVAAAVGASGRKLGSMPRTSC